MAELVLGVVVPVGLLVEVVVPSGVEAHALGGCPLCSDSELCGCILVDGLCVAVFVDGGYLAGLVDG